MIIYQLFHIGEHYRWSDSPIWGFVLGIGFIAMPFTAFAMFTVYILMIGIPIGLGILGVLFWSELFGKTNWAIIAFLAGGWLGVKIYFSDFFYSNVLESLFKLSHKDEE